MEPAKHRLLESIDRDRDLLIALLQEFIRTSQSAGCRSTARRVRTLLVRTGRGPGHPGRRLALNRRFDGFPGGSGEGWTRDPWGGERVDGKIYGAGACDVKAGTTAPLFTLSICVNRVSTCAGS